MAKYGMVSGLEAHVDVTSVNGRQFIEKIIRFPSAFGCQRHPCNDNEDLHLLQESMPGQLRGEGSTSELFRDASST